LHEPSPLAKPQRLSASQTPLSQTRSPFWVVHVASMGSALGKRSPFATFGVHAPELHHWLPAQSVSTAQTLPHAPVVKLQIGPACAPAQSAFELHTPQLPALLPEVTQYGSSLVGHAKLALVPSSPLHAVHVSVVTLQSGVAPEHAEAFDAVHATHVALVVSHAGVAPAQFESDAHCPHFPASGPVEAHTDERHTVVASLLSHGPSPLA
jgi:hypothetical protein